MESIQNLKCSDRDTRESRSLWLAHCRGILWGIVVRQNVSVHTLRCSLYPDARFWLRFHGGSLALHKDHL